MSPPKPGRKAGAKAEQNSAYGPLRRNLLRVSRYQIHESCVAQTPSRPARASRRLSRPAPRSSPQQQQQQAGQTAGGQQPTGGAAADAAADASPAGPGMSARHDDDAAWDVPDARSFRRRASSTTGRGITLVTAAHWCRKPSFRSIDYHGHAGGRLNTPEGLAGLMAALDELNVKLFVARRRHLGRQPRARR